MIVKASDKKPREVNIRIFKNSKKEGADDTKQDNLVEKFLGLLTFPL